MSERSDWRKEKRKVGGSIKTIKGYLYARIQYTDEITGRRKEKLKRARNRTHARELIEQMRGELAGRGQAAVEEDKITFLEVADRYEKARLNPPIFRNGIKVSGLRSYKAQRYLLKPLKEFLGRRAIRTVKPSDLESYKAERLNTPVVIERKIKRKNPNKERRKFIYKLVRDSRVRSLASVNRELSLLRQIFVFALSEDLILRNPFERAKKLISQAAEIQRDRILTLKEEVLILEACESESRKHIRPIVIAALDTAMRKGELIKLKWSDVDFSSGVVTVQATNAKTEKSRLIGITSRLRVELKTLWECSPKEEDFLVFGIRDNFNRAWRSARVQAGLEDTDLHFHDLRHTAITRMIRAGIPASEAMKISGHSEMKTFQRYVNLTEDSVTASASLLDCFNQSQNEIDREEFTLMN